MSLEAILDYPEAQMVVLQTRYGYGFVAGIELEDFPVISTINENNGEFEVDYYGQLSAPDSWFPYATGKTPQDAVRELEEKLKALSKDDISNVGLGLNILRGLGKMPTHGLKVRPVTLEDLRAWVHGWNHCDVQNEDMFV